MVCGSALDLLDCTWRILFATRSHSQHTWPRGDSNILLWFRSESDLQLLLVVHCGPVIFPFHGICSRERHPFQQYPEAVGLVAEVFSLPSCFGHGPGGHVYHTQTGYIFFRCHWHAQIDVVDGSAFGDNVVGCGSEHALSDHSPHEWLDPFVESCWALCVWRLGQNIPAYSNLPSVVNIFKYPFASATMMTDAKLEIRGAEKPYAIFLFLRTRSRPFLDLFDLYHPC